MIRNTWDWHTIAIIIHYTFEVVPGVRGSKSARIKDEVMGGSTVALLRFFFEVERENCPETSSKEKDACLGEPCSSHGDERGGAIPG